MSDTRLESIRPESPPRESKEASHATVKASDPEPSWSPEEERSAVRK
jgi:hypothetical protein